MKQLSVYIVNRTIRIIMLIIIIIFSAEFIFTILQEIIFVDIIIIRIISTVK